MKIQDPLSALASDNGSARDSNGESARGPDTVSVPTLGGGSAPDSGAVVAPAPNGESAQDSDEEPAQDLDIAPDPNPGGKFAPGPNGGYPQDPNGKSAPATIVHIALAQRVALSSTVAVYVSDREPDPSSSAAIATVPNRGFDSDPSRGFRPAPIAVFPMVITTAYVDPPGVETVGTPVKEATESVDTSGALDSIP